MATYGWRKDHSVAEWLFAEGYRFDFFQAVKLLTQLYPDAAVVGDGNDPNKEAIRFRSKVSFDFPSSTVDEVKSCANEKKVEMVVNFLGLAGTLGPLPKPYTELILERVKHKDEVLKDFLDIFNHRLISLFYQLRKVHRVGLETATPGADKIARYLYALIGLGTEGLHNRLPIKDRALLFYAGIFAQQPRSAVGLEKILSDYFQCPVKTEQFLGQWLNLDEDQVTRLGKNGQNQCLSRDAVVVGRRIWDQQNRIELGLGPLKLRQFLNFLPTGWGFQPLCEMTKFYLNGEIDFGFRLILKKTEVPVAKLSTSTGARLSWTACLKTEPEVAADVEVKLSPESFIRQRKIHLPLFDVLPLAEYLALVSRLTTRRFAANAILCRQGEPGDSRFIISKGAVEIKRTEADGRARLLSILSTGDTFRAVDADNVRSATAMTLEESEILEISRQDLASFFARYPEAARFLQPMMESF